MTDPVRGYDEGAAVFVHQYEQLDAEAVHAQFLESLPEGGDRLALDIGAGSGRDAAWLRRKGFEVVAVEPSTGMRTAGQSLHPDPLIRWVDDRLPSLAATHRLGLAFDVILLSGVLMHVTPTDRPRAFRKVVTLLKPGGVVLISVRSGSGESDRPMWPVSRGEIEGYARTHGLNVVRVASNPDLQGRVAVTWTSFVLSLPDDGAGALPLLRGIILNDDKSATYKLGLLRAVARIADSVPALAVERVDEDMVDIPLGAVALNWLRMYLPLAAAGLPQLPGNRGAEKLGFAKDAFRRLLAEGVAGQDLRIGSTFSGEMATTLAKAMADARTTISNMPAHYTRYPNSESQVFIAQPSKPPGFGSEINLDEDTLRSFGTLAVPGPIWRTLQRLGAWVEPVLISEWARLIEGFAIKMGRGIKPGEIEAGLRWLDPERDTRLARMVALQRLELGETVRCVWTGNRLKRDAFDIDHCLPWSAWPCSDLWNLLPAAATVNRNEKRERLPAPEVLQAARNDIKEWWRQAWEADSALSQKFRREATAALPLHGGGDLDDIFAGLEWRRLRLRQDQQVQEWAGPKPRKAQARANTES